MPPPAQAGLCCHMSRAARCGWRKDGTPRGKYSLKKAGVETETPNKSMLARRGGLHISHLNTFKKKIIKSLLNGCNTHHICLMRAAVTGSAARGFK